MVTHAICQISEGSTVKEMLMNIHFNLTVDIKSAVKVYYDHRSDDDDKIVKVVTTNDCANEFVAGKHYSWSEALVDCIDREIDLLSQDHKMNIDRLRRSLIISDIFTELNENGFGEEIFCEPPE